MRALSVPVQVAKTKQGGKEDKVTGESSATGKDYLAYRNSSYILA